MTTVGLIGLGKMGLPIAGNLIEAGHEIVGYRRSIGRTELEQLGGRSVSSPAEVAASCRVLITILPTAADVEEVVLGPHGTLTTLAPGSVHIEMSTIDADSKRGFRHRVENAGSAMLDAPISGSPGMVAPRLATTFASGDPAAVEQVADVLAAISGPWVNTGEFGTGTTLKYIASMLMATHTVAAAEAISLARRHGLDLDLVQRTLDNSIAGSAVLRQRGPVMAERRWVPAPGPVSTLHEILEQVEAHLRQLGEERPLFEAAKAVFDQALGDGWGELDIASVHDQVTGQDALHAVPQPQELHR